MREYWPCITTGAKVHLTAEDVGPGHHAVTLCGTAALVTGKDPLKPETIKASHVCSNCRLATG